MARSFSQEARSDSHKIGETRYRMSHLTSSTTVARTVLFAGVLLAILMLSFRSFLPAFAQEAETIEYAEDRTDEVVAYTAVDPEGEDITWSLTGTDAADFDITDGVLTFENQPDYESPADDGTDNQYNVTVQANDGTNTETRTLVIEVTDVDEPGTVTLGNRQPQLNTALTATLSDLDGFPSGLNIRWRWAISTSPNGPWTNIRRLANDSLTSTYPNAVTSTYTPDKDDVGFYLRATATYTDGHGENKSKAAVSENPVVKNLINDPPAFVYVEGDEIPIGAPDTNDEVGEPIPGDPPTTPRKVAENSAAGTTVGAPVKAIDEDGDTVTYDLAGDDAGWFDIDMRSGQISVKARTDRAMLNKESPADDGADGTYTVTVTAKDPSDTSDTITVNIEITDVPEAPEITGGDTSIDHDENTPIVTALDDYTATDDEDAYDDPDDDNNEIVLLKWSLSGADSDMFEISNADGTRGALTFKEMPDYEVLSNTQKSNGLKLSVTVTDSADMTDSRNVTVSVTNVDETGTVTLSNLQPQVGTRITASLTDPDGSTSNLRWQWASTQNEDGTSLGQLTQPATSNAYTPVAGDLNRYLFAFASYTDPEGSNKTATSTPITNYTVKVENRHCNRTASRNNGAYFQCTGTTSGNEAPVFADQDSGTQGFRHISESIDENDGTAIFGTPITATDDQNVSCDSSQSELAGTGCTDRNLKAATSTATSTLMATSSEEDLQTYSLEGTDANLFTINRATAEVTPKAPLDFENPTDRDRNNEYRFTIRATDPSDIKGTARTASGGTSRSYTIDVTIEVDDVEEAPEITGGEADIKIPENTAISTVLSTYTATDDEDDYDDPNDDGNEIVPLKWSLSGDDVGDFKLSVETGASTNLMFRESPDFESPADNDTDNEYSVTVTATDGAGMNDMRTVTVTVSNVDEPGTVTLSAQQPQVDVALTAKLIDPDGQDDQTPPLTLNDSADSHDNLTVEATWQWARSTSSTGGWTDIEDARSNSYMATSTDVGYYLRATATYDDGHGEDKSKSAVSRHPVRAKIYTNTAPTFVYVQGDEIPGNPYPDIDGTPGPDDLDGDANIDKYAVGDKIPDVNRVSATVTRKVAENSPAGTNVGPPVFAKDIGENGRQENLTYELDDENPALDTDPEDRFTIDSATGQIRVKAGTTLDREVTSSYTVTVTAKDPSHTTGTLSMDTIEVVITVTDVLEAPKITAGDTATSTPEAVRDVLASYTATDDEDITEASPSNPLKWSLSGADSDMFKLCVDTAAAPCVAPTGTEAQLTFKDSPDYEALSSAQKSNGLKLTVTVTDSDDMSASRNVTVTVTNDEETGTVTLSRVQPQVGTSITASLTDPDGTTSNLKWQWASSPNTAPNDSGRSQLTQPSTSNAYTPVAGDLDRYLFAFASYTDPEGANKTATSTPITNYTVKVKNEYCTRTTTRNSGTANEHEQCTSHTSGNKSPVFPDQDPNVQGFQNATTMSIDENTASEANIGTAVTALDTENIACSDNTIQSRTGCHNLRNNATSTSATEVLATTTAGTTDRLTYSLEGTDRSSFTINRQTGQIQTRASLDYETKKSYSVSVKATDPSGSTATNPSGGRTNINVTINVTGVDESPRVFKKSLAITGSGSRNYPETETNRQVATYSAEGPDGTRRWSLSGDDSGDFSISSGGALSFRNQPNFESPADSDSDNVYRVTVTATVGDLTDSLDVVVTVTNVNEDGTVTITPSGQPRVGVELTASVTDEDGTPTAVTWQWARSADGSTGWGDVGATSATYTPVEGDVGNFLRATASYTDPQGSGKSADAVTSAAVQADTVIDNNGVLSFAPGRSIVGSPVSVSIDDPDGGVTGISWEWARGSSASGSFSSISDATSASYTPIKADAGQYLQVTATYTDSLAPNQSASAVTGPVALHEYDADASGKIERDEVIAAIRDYLFNNALDRDGVIEVIRLYLFP